MADLGTGITIVFGTSAFSAELLSINGTGATRGEYETTNMATTGDKTFSPMKLAEQGTIDMEWAFDPDAQPPIAGAAETVTITFPLPAGGLTSATLAGSGFITSFEWTGPLEEKMTATATLRWAAGVTWTAST